MGVSAQSTKHGGCIFHVERLAQGESLKVNQGIRPDDQSIGTLGGDRRGLKPGILHGERFTAQRFIMRLLH